MISHLNPPSVQDLWNVFVCVFCFVCVYFVCVCVCVFCVLCVCVFVCELYNDIDI